MDLSPLQYGLGAGAGSLVGFSLGLVGGGGSILAVPLIVYLVGVKDFRQPDLFPIKSTSNLDTVRLFWTDFVSSDLDRTVN
ncbi:hypothetical protein [Brevundimonas mediterranea]|uniref:Sulfite exporter TauE/SafE family protein n=1 Tax=Brevundimonas mediterranea TaxID=74329 RepID=A0A7Z8Y2E9_9CAUL|nr:hypothetical protein [Brevundimonas mediterranea]VDC49641.1 hypothetical protein BREV_BREV_00128 [Brevundimonas mediterranea]